MPTSVFDERGELLQSFDSDVFAFTFALGRQRSGKLTTMLMSDGAEVMFAPHVPGGKRAETALEYQARMNVVVKEEMERDTTAKRIASFWRRD